MTSHYIDLTLLPDPESSAAQLFGALYDRLHLTLVQHRQSTIGVSFPGYSLSPRTLGNRLRLHGRNEDLSPFLLTDWLKGMRDHVRVSPISVVPDDASHRTVQRQQFKTSAERMRRRRMRRKGETEEQAAAAIPLSAERQPTLPYTHMRSTSSGHSYCLFIAVGPPTQQPITGNFNSHGLSPTATIPWF